MALDFPANPTNGQVYDSYVYNSTVGAWQAREDSATVAITSPTAPATANNGDIWYNSNTGVSYVYYADGSSAQWVEIVSSAVPLLDTKADLAGDTFTGNVTAPRFVSNVATGTSPLSITSTTVNTNLNADLLDGNHASAFSLTSHTHDDIVSKGVLSAETGRSVHDSGIYTFNTNNSSLGDSTPTEYWSTLAWGRGAAGSAELAATWTTNGNELWYRSLRDVTDNWWAWKKIYHSGNTVPVANGGTGATTLTSGGYLKGAGTAAITSQTGIPAGDITSGTLDYSRFPSGTIVQVQSTTVTAAAAYSIGAFSLQDVGVNVTITPKSASNKIFIVANVSSAGVSFGRPAIVLARNTTRIGVGNAAGSRNQISGSGAQGETAPGTQTVNFLDSPATTSAITYRAYIVNLHSATQQYNFNYDVSNSDNGSHGRTASTITVMEVVA